MLSPWHKAGLTALNLLLIAGCASAVWSTIRQETAYQRVMALQEQLDTYIERQQALNGQLRKVAVETADAHNMLVADVAKHAADAQLHYVGVTENANA